VLLEHSIQPVQQFAYTSGKNATDSSLIIDAMDLMYTRRFDGFCLVSSDSDFTRLAQRLREEGLMVYGFGEQKTPDAFRQACDKFIYTEVLRPSGGALSAPAQSTPTGPARKAAARKGPSATAKSRDGAEARAGAKSRGGANARDAAQAAATAPAATTTAATRTASTTAVPATSAAAAAPPATADTERPGAATLPLRLLRQAIDQGSDDTGWANLAGVGHYVNKVRPDFDPRLYGCKKLSDLFRAHPRQFQVEERQVGPARALFVRTVE
jgi:hypothetical protein